MSDVTRILSKDIDYCEECPHYNGFSVDCVAHATCSNGDRKEYNLPWDGKEGTELMLYHEPPDDCPLPKKNTETFEEYWQGQDAPIYHNDIAEQATRMLWDALHPEPEEESKDGS